MCRCVLALPQTTTPRLSGPVASCLHRCHRRCLQHHRSATRPSRSVLRSCRRRATRCATPCLPASAARWTPDHASRATRATSSTGQPPRRALAWVAQQQEGEQHLERPGKGLPRVHGGESRWKAFNQSVVRLRTGVDDGCPLHPTEGFGGLMQHLISLIEVWACNELCDRGSLSGSHSECVVQLHV